MKENKTKILVHLEKIFRKVRDYLLERGLKEREKFSENPEKPGDVSAKFDLEVEKIVTDYCQREKLKVLLYSEERGKVKLAQRPKWTIFLDPVDGSINFSRGIEGTAFSIAIVPGEIEIEKGLRLEEIEYGLVGSIISGSICYAQKGKGVYYKGVFSGFKEKRVFGSKIRDLENACLEIDLDFGSVSPIEKINKEKSQKIKRIFPLIYPKRQVKFIRRNGSAALALMEVATGAIDAYVDLRDRLTPENWLAPYLLIKEAGGVFTDFKGKEIGEIKSFREPFSILASGNKILHQKILKLLRATLDKK
jgi:fructose-1,6-bisphosphatase/inositol monophosphatase family enzyme